jgi:hypothetical protein
MNLRTLQGLAATLQGKSEVTIDKTLRERRLTPTEAICVRHMIMAATVQEQVNEMRAASGGAPRPTNETQRLLARAGFKLGKWYGSGDVDRLLTQAGYGPEDRIACRIELQELGMTGEPGEGSRRLQASAERPGRVLADRHGRPLVIRAFAE